MHVLQSRVLLKRHRFGRATAFYERDLGLVRYRDWGEPPRRGVVYFLGGGFLEITELDDDASEVAAAPAPPVKLWLQVADLDETWRELADRDVPVLAEPELKRWGLMEMTIVDPDGLEIVIIETPTTHPLRRRQ